MGGQKDNATPKSIPRPSSHSFLEKSSAHLGQKKKTGRQKTYTRQEYLKRLSSGVGSFLTLSLRTMENLKRDWQDWKKK